MEKTNFNFGREEQHISSFFGEEEEEEIGILENRNDREGEREKFFFPPLHVQRKKLISRVLKDEKSCIHSVLFLGCGNGSVMRYLIRDGYQYFCGIDVCKEDLDEAKFRLLPQVHHHLDPVYPQLTVVLRKEDICTLSQKKKEKKWMKEFDAVVMTEVIEHIPKEYGYKALEFVFSVVQPNVFIMTTPNREFNKWWWPDEWETSIRDDDHKFEFTRKQFSDYCKELVKVYKSYKIIEMDGVGTWENDIGEDSMKHGYATQFCVFKKKKVKPVFQKDLKIDYEDSIYTLEYPRDKDTRNYREKVFDEVLYIYSILSQFTQMKNGDYMSIEECYDKVKCRKNLNEHLTKEVFEDILIKLGVESGKIEFDNERKLFKVIPFEENKYDDDDRRENEFDEIEEEEEEENKTIVTTDYVENNDEDGFWDDAN